MITKEQYEEAVSTNDKAEEIINAYHKQQANNFEFKWGKFKAGELVFKDEELLYAAYARCDACNAGLAYPKECAGFHFWSCSDELKGLTKGHATFPFAFYSIKSEGQPSAGGNTTRVKSNSSSASQT